MGLIVLMLGITMGLAVRVMSGIKDGGLVQKTAQANVMQSGARLLILRRYQQYNFRADVSSSIISGTASPENIGRFATVWAGHPFANSLGWARVIRTTAVLPAQKGRSAAAATSAAVIADGTPIEFDIVVGGGTTWKTPAAKTSAETGVGTEFETRFYYGAKFYDHTLSSTEGAVKFDLTSTGSWYPFRLDAKPYQTTYPWN